MVGLGLPSFGFLKIELRGLSRAREGTMGSRTSDSGEPNQFRWSQCVIEAYVLRVVPNCGDKLSVPAQGDTTYSIMLAMRNVVLKFAIFSRPNTSST